MTCGFSGGADSTALVALSTAAGCRPTAVHVDHGLRPSSAEEADDAGRIAAALGVPFERRIARVGAGPNLEARARDARRAVLGADALVGHTADDRAETLLVNLLRGAGADGLGALGPSPTRPLLALRRRDTVALCRHLGLVPVVDPTNTDRRFLRNRIRHELVPLLDDIAGRDVTPLLVRTAALLAADAELAAGRAADVVTDDARVLAALPPPLARRAVRQWLGSRGHRPDLGSVERVLAVARGEAVACELAGGLRVERHRQRLRAVTSAAVALDVGMQHSAAGPAIVPDTAEAPDAGTWRAD